MADRIAFRLNGTLTTVAADVAPSMTVLHWLRGPAGLCGTKEGCAEGDCGACTVVLEQPGGGRTPVNSCLLAMGQLHGASLRTIEGLRDHPIQHAFAAGNATQCGFCTPGFVMAAWAHAAEGGDVHDALAGNLCRCTGYRPIVDAVAALDPDPVAPPMLPGTGAACFEADGCRFHRPTGLDDLLALRAADPAATLLAGGTDLGVALADGHRPAAIICLQAVPELARLDSRPDGLVVGAAVRYSELLPILDGAGLAPLRPLLIRLGSRQIRGLGTLGGNLATASPIGDMLPPLLALGATLRLRSLAGARELSVEAFLLGYRHTALRADEIIESVFIPRPPASADLVCEKLSKRHDQDISTVSAAFLLDRADGTIRLAFGGMGPKAARAPGAEAALAPWSAAALERAAAALAADFEPLTDWRGTADYRLRAAQGLLRRLWWRIEQPGLPAEIHAL